VIVNGCAASLINISVHKNLFTGFTTAALPGAGLTKFDGHALAIWAIYNNNYFDTRHKGSGS
jgi:hypothetical protein